MRCPACRARLSGAASEDAERGSGGEFVCTGCGVSYPVVDGIPWLYRDVRGSRAQWAAKLQQFRTDLLAEHAELESATQLEDSLPSTRERLTQKKAGLERFGQQVFGLLEPFAFAHSEAGGGLPRERIPSQQHVTSYLDTAFRDWAWGEREIQETLAEILPSIATKSPESKALVLGGGAGRFSVELARSERVGSVSQLDLNPLLTRIGALAQRGETVSLTEIPRFPRSLDDVAVDHALRAPSSSGRGEGAVHFLLGDAFAPPFESESFDLLVTPWFIDILPESFRSVARRLGALLSIGGQWLSFGPLSFESVGEPDRMSPVEMAEALDAAGFEVVETRLVRVDYLHSPHDMARRGEEIFVFSATRRRAVSAEKEFSFYPDWMTDGTLSIPAIPEFERRRAEHTFDLEILKCIDGRISIEEVVATLSSRYGLEPDRCRNTVNRFFSRILEAD